MSEWIRTGMCAECSVPLTGVLDVCMIPKYEAGCRTNYTYEHENIGTKIQLYLRTSIFQNLLFSLFVLLRPRLN